MRLICHINGPKKKKMQQNNTGKKEINSRKGNHLSLFFGYVRAGTVPAACICIYYYYHHRYSFSPSSVIHASPAPRTSTAKSPRLRGASVRHSNMRRLIQTMRYIFFFPTLQFSVPYFSSVIADDLNNSARPNNKLWPTKSYGLSNVAKSTP